MSPPSTPRAVSPSASALVRGVLGGSTPRLCHSPIWDEQQDKDEREHGSQSEDSQEVQFSLGQDIRYPYESFSRSQYDQDADESFSDTQDVQPPRNQDDQDRSQPTFVLMHPDTRGHHLPTTNYTTSTNLFASNDEDYPMHDPDSEELQADVDIERRDLPPPPPCDHLVLLQEVVQAIHALNEAVNNAFGRYDLRCSV
ncbi:hypothetical protein H1R20_g1894, partial [Candolleomyces eurysporus]